MAALQYRAVHVRELLNLSRTELQRWLSTLPPFSIAPTHARTARLFTITDLAFFSMVALLQRRLDLPLRTIASFSTAMYEHVGTPATSTSSPARFFLNQSDDDSWQVGSEASGVLSLSVDPASIWQSVYQFVGLELPAQANLPFALMSVLPSHTMEPSHVRRTR